MSDARSKEERAAWQRQYRRDFPDVVRASNRRYYQRHREQRLAYEADPERRRKKAERMRAMRARDPELARLKFRAWNYGLTIEQVKVMLDAGCAVCGSKDNLHIDHDHSCCPSGASPRSCGKCVRGALCHSCNVAMGILEESPERIQALLDHVQGFRFLGDR